MKSDPNIVTIDELVSAGGADRLLLRFVEDPDDADTEFPGLDFHSVVWEVRQGDLWFEHVVITAADFQRGNDRGRWVSALHHWNPVSGVAILQVGEEQLPDAHAVTWVQYSWCEWDLRNNREIRGLRVCRTPWENLDGTKRPPRRVSN
ncbi:MAG TPA: hypothetical protein VKD90_30745 [Gemmataceae bacterium]|nr:hypothetical protein [Gemmataceae bacterium]